MNNLMRIFAPIILILSTSVVGASNSSIWTVQITKIYDGDTFNFIAPMMPVPLNAMKVRIRGIDAPEKGGRARCQSEKDMAIKAYDKLVLIKGASSWAELSNLSWDKYGGRIVADAKINGLDVKTEMLKEHLVVEYSGSGKKQDWCKIPKTK